MTPICPNLFATTDAAAAQAQRDAVLALPRTADVRQVAAHRAADAPVHHLGTADWVQSSCGVTDGISASTGRWSLMEAMSHRWYTYYVSPVRGCQKSFGLRPTSASSSPGRGQSTATSYAPHPRRTSMICSSESAFGPFISPSSTPICAGPSWPREFSSTSSESLHLSFATS